MAVPLQVAIPVLRGIRLALIRAQRSFCSESAMTTVCIFAQSIGHALETIGYFLRSSGVDVTISRRRRR